MRFQDARVEAFGGEQLGGLMAIHVALAVAEHRVEGAVGIDNVPLHVGDKDGVVDLVCGESDVVARPPVNMPGSPILDSFLKYPIPYIARRNDRAPRL